MSAGTLMIQLSGLQMIELADVFQNSLIPSNTHTVRISAEILLMAHVVQIAMTADSHIQLEMWTSGDQRMPCADVTHTDISN
jgi:hypothetical protein